MGLLYSDLNIHTWNYFINTYTHYPCIKDVYLNTGLMGYVMITDP